MEEPKQAGYQRPLDLLCPHLISGQEISQAKAYLLCAVSETPETVAALCVRAAPEALSVEAASARKLLILVARARET